ncbi:BamA/TamA family outer membrane protein [Aureibacter tunicatorum]|uniref:Outer membrane protein assembly factor BamA n=1 Tax=Aureibacter tunicatorum TaxID=866807 RepID=A0AAE3XQI6_9BACT|nr:BamA/TamA family outer membrane protein [Aureibacter tunicatorum]MDR6240742.1 outer membrane protein assembly factor BamA [Aureibacter tunicatorum]BDD06925.1 hypothetical protein AUTU_44080 [Aureibacter tunicatorum]
MKRYFIFVLLSIFWSFNSSFAQFGSSNVDTDSTQQEMNFVSNTITNVMDLMTYEKGRFSFGIFPVMDYEEYKGVEIGLMPVFRFAPKDTVSQGRFYRPTTIMPQFSFSTKGQVNIETDFVSFIKGKWSIVSRLNYLKYQDVFYGVGDPLEEEERSTYNTERFFWYLELLRNINDVFFVGVKADMMYARHFDVTGGSFNQDIVGFEEGAALGVGPTIKFDTRDNTLYPTNGSLLSVSAIFYDKALGSDFDFQSYNLDMRKYVTLKEDKTILAIQGVVNSTQGDAPFYKLPRFGGSRGMRGISHPAKYADKNNFFTQAEIRQHLWWRFSAAAFVGIGNTSEKFDHNLFNDIKTVYGFGGRFQLLPNDKINFRADMGFGPNGDRAFYFSVTEAF